jgi:uncharacterized protein YraI
MRGMTAGVAAPTVFRVPLPASRKTSGRAVATALIVYVACGMLIGTGGGARASDVAYVATDVLNLRAGPGTSAVVLAQMVQGEALPILAGPSHGGWYKVDYSGVVGWAYGRYLSIDGAPGWGSRADRDRVGGGDPPGPEHWIDGDRTTRTVSLMVGDEAIASYAASLGWDESDDGFYATAIGTYSVYGMNADLTWTDWGQAYIRDWVAFDPQRRNGFHAWSMDADGNVIPNGDGPTGGCVALAPWAADELFAFADYGMRVEVHW